MTDKGYGLCHCGCGRKTKISKINNAHPAVNVVKGRPLKFIKGHGRWTYEQKQIPNKLFRFACGCSGVLPMKGFSNKLATWVKSWVRKNGNLKPGGWRCRITAILIGGATSARRDNCVHVPKNTKHSTIRKLMEKKTCVLCGKSLSWEKIDRVNTPHFHHDRTNGNIVGFSHSSCNIHDLKRAVIKLKAEVLILRNR